MDMDGMQGTRIWFTRGSVRTIVIVFRSSYIFGKRIVCKLELSMLTERVSFNRYAIIAYPCTVINHNVNYFVHFHNWSTYSIHGEEESTKCKENEANTTECLHIFNLITREFSIILLFS